MTKPDATRVGMAWQDPTMLQIGKAGLNERVIAEAKRLLKRHEYIKVRLLRSALDMGPKKEIFVNLCSKTKAQLIGIRGNTAVIFRPRKR
ncbi:MAG: RNA-binding protein [Candidatus Lokiarchaeota archaeon]|nr:RNA-binding protein [Candidatus Lokiarchaeota archaeon]